MGNPGGLIGSGVLMLGSKGRLRAGEPPQPSLSSLPPQPVLPCLLNKRQALKPRGPLCTGHLLFPLEITALEVFYLPPSSFLTFLSDHSGVARAAWAQGPPVSHSYGLTSSPWVPGPGGGWACPSRPGAQQRGNQLRTRLPLLVPPTPTPSGLSSKMSRGVQMGL